MFNDDLQDLDKFYNNYSKPIGSNNKRNQPQQVQSQKVLGAQNPKIDNPYNSQSNLNAYQDQQNYTSIPISSDTDNRGNIRSPRRHSDENPEYQVYRTHNTSKKFMFKF